MTTNIASVHVFSKKLENVVISSDLISPKDAVSLVQRKLVINTAQATGQDKGQHVQYYWVKGYLVHHEIEKLTWQTVLYLLPGLTKDAQA